MMIKFSSSSSLLTFDFCTKSVAHKREEFLTKVNHKHSKKTDTKFSLSSLSLSLSASTTTEEQLFLHALRRTLVF